ncbi:MAG: NAD(P)-dependent alcohol dehydrogenase, partial [Cytophagales bacterium]|nr:NAD(P)-dependent alcohol dehydrogenase [Cytophagales bacterium]
LGGAFAEYVSIPAKNCGLLPEGMDAIKSACLPTAGLTALQALITHGKLQPGESVLVNGSSGGVGHLTVQLAKIYGAKVTAVCSSRNRDFVLGLGADAVIAYDQEDIHQHAGRYDLVVDTHGNLTYSDFKRMGARGVLVGFTTMGNMASTLLSSKIYGYPLTLFTAASNTKDLETLAGLMHTGKLNIHIEKTYPAKEIPAAIGYIEAMHTRGKVAMVW